MDPLNNKKIKSTHDFMLCFCCCQNHIFMFLSKADLQLTKTHFCQAQSQLQVKLSLKTELVLFSFNPATHPPPTHPAPPRPGKFNFQLFSVNVDQVAIQEYIRIQIGRRPELFGKWKTTSIFWKMEDNLHYWAKWKTASISR
jgi:hypothetical protein